MVYHVAIVFQPWGLMIGFITSKKSWEDLWIPMSMLNVWRIPLLFFISGMGVYYSFQNRHWKQLLIERSLRIFIPFVFGFFVIVPLYMFILQYYYGWKRQYLPNPGHLWFLGNIFSYVILTIPLLAYVKKHRDSKWIKGLNIIMCKPVSLFFIIAFFMLEMVLVRPALFELYAMTWHGFFLGWLAFIIGYLFAMNGVPFWSMLVKYRWLYLVLAIILYLIRMTKLFVFPLNLNLPAESCLFILSILAFGNKYLNHNNGYLNYLGKAAYPVYIIHMIFIEFSCMLILPVDMHVTLKYAGVLILTISGSLFFYEFIIRRNNILKLLFGVKVDFFTRSHHIDKNVKHVPGTI
jgi:glucans biosynthesis protein C